MMGVPGPQRTAAANASDSRSKFPSNYFAKGPRDKAVDDTDRKIPVQRACNWCVPHVFEYRYLEVKCKAARLCCCVLCVARCFFASLLNGPRVSCMIFRGELNQWSGR